MKNQNILAQHTKLLISTGALAATLGGWVFFANQSPPENTSISEAAPAAPEIQIPQWLLEKPIIPTLQPVTEAAPAAAPPSSAAPAAAPPNLREVNESVAPAPPVQQDQITTTRRQRPARITSTQSTR